MMTTTLITSALIGRVRERSMSLGFASASMPTVHAHAGAVPSVDVCASATEMMVTTAPDAAMTNLWLGGFQGKGFGSGAYGTKRIHPGRLEGMT